MPNHTVSGNVDTMMRAADNAAIRSAIGVGQTDAPTFNSVNITNTATANVFSTSAAALQTAGYLGVARAINLIDTAGISWSSTSTLLGATGTNLFQDAAGILAQRNGTAKQALRVYNTNLSGAPEWAEFDWITSGGTNTLRIGTNLSGTGAARPIDFVTGGVVRMSISAAGLLQLGNTTSAFPAIKRNGTGIDIRLADDSTFTTINASDYTGYNGGVAKTYVGGAGVFQAVSTGYFALCSSAINVFSQDTFLSRSAPGVWQMGTSSTNAAADLRLRSVIQQPPATITPANNGDLVVEATSNTLLTFKFKGSDGTVRSGTLVVA